MARDERDSIRASVSRYLETDRLYAAYAIGDLEPKSTTTATVADVHTEPNSRQVLEVGTGRLNVIWVAAPIGDGDYFICAGPVLSFHEFKHPMSDRLTDEKWRSMLKKNEAPITELFRKP